MKRSESEGMRSRLQRAAVAVVAVATTMVAVGTAAAADGSFSKLAERLANLRSEVDSLTSEVDEKESRLQSRLRSIQRQRADIELRIEKAKMRVKRLRSSIEEHRQKVEKRAATNEELEPSVDAAIGTLRTSVREGPPFKKSARLTELEKLESQVDDGMLSPQKAVSRLWQFVEDELRLSRENGLYQQVIEIDGEEVLADVARVGMVSLYFTTEDGRAGLARRTDDGWAWRRAESDEERRRIEKLIESFRKNVRVGYFRIPNGLDGIERVEASDDARGSVEPTEEGK